MIYKDINDKDIRALDMLHRHTGLELVIEDGRITRQIERKKSQAAATAREHNK